MERQSHTTHTKANPLQIISVISLIVYVAMQLFFLTEVGTKGQDLADIRNRQGQVRVENEMLKAKILELRSNQVVLAGLESRSNVVAKNVQIIDSEAFSIAAQN